MRSLWLKAGLAATGVTLAGGTAAMAFAGTSPSAHQAAARTAANQAVNQTAKTPHCKLAPGKKTPTRKTKGNLPSATGTSAKDKPALLASGKFAGCAGSGKDILVAGTVTAVGQGKGGYSALAFTSDQHERFTVLLTPETTVTRRRTGGKPTTLATGQHLLIKGITAKSPQSLRNSPKAELGDGLPQIKALVIVE
jgi:hypothetical protein